MDIIIGEHQLVAHRTAASDAVLLAETGCTAAEHAVMLDRDASAYEVARALRPMLADAPDLPTLVEMIEDAGRAPVRVETIALLVSSTDVSQPAAVE
uniref:hypothetical protein n=1 Tax=uncultured Sphingomonas sp. TaxID=158754 RepID=UPI0035CC09CF